MPNALIKKVDCIHVEVSDLESGLAFYRDQLGYEPVWRTDSAAGLNMGDGSNEIVLNATPWEHKTDLLVDSVPEAIERFKESGGTVLSGPFEIAIGQAAVVRDPWGNEFVLLDAQKGLLATDDAGNRYREPLLKLIHATRLSQLLPGVTLLARHHLRAEPPSLNWTKPTWASSSKNETTLRTSQSTTQIAQTSWIARLPTSFLRHSRMSGKTTMFEWPSSPEPATSISALVMI